MIEKILYKMFLLLWNFPFFKKKLRRIIVFVSLFGTNNSQKIKAALIIVLHNNVLCFNICFVLGKTFE